jgi:hypothetical protein
MNSLLRMFRPLAVGSLFAFLLVSGAQAAPVAYSVTLSGPNEFPPNASPGTGTGQVDIDNVAHTMHVHVVFSGLLGTTSASHIHAATTTPGTGTAGVATTTPTFAGFPLGVTAGSYDNTLDMTQTSSYNPSYITAHGGTTTQAEADLFQAIAEGRAYLNIHTSSFSGGEIRGFLLPAAIPVENTTWGRLKVLYQ